MMGKITTMETIAVVGETLWENPWGNDWANLCGKAYWTCIKSDHAHVRILTDRHDWHDEWRDVSHLYVVTSTSGGFPIPTYREEYTPEYWISGEDFECGHPVMLPTPELPIPAGVGITVCTPIAMLYGHPYRWHVKRRRWAHIILERVEHIGWTLSYEPCHRSPLDQGAGVPL